MRRNNTVNTREAKRLARDKYAERQIEKWLKWTINMRGKMLYRELVEQHDKYDIKVYAEQRR